MTLLVFWVEIMYLYLLLDSDILFYMISLLLEVFVVEKQKLKIATSVRVGILILFI